MLTVATILNDAADVNAKDCDVLIAPPGRGPEAAAWHRVELFYAHEDGAVFGVVVAGSSDLRRVSAVLAAR